MELSIVHAVKRTMNGAKTAEMQDQNFFSATMIVYLTIVVCIGWTSKNNPITQLRLAVK